MNKERVKQLINLAKEHLEETPTPRPRHIARAMFSLDVLLSELDEEDSRHK